jgi:hypothetical protein
MGKAVRSVTKTLIGGDSGNVMKDARRAGKSAARSIKSQPFNVEFKDQQEQATQQREAGQQRQTAAVQEGSALRQQLAATARGEGPSLAEAQMRQAQDRSLAQQLATAASARGGSPAALQRQLARQQATAGQQIAQDAGVARMQEAQAAQSQLGQMLAQEQAAADQAVNNYLRLGLSIDQAEAAAQQDLERLRTQARTGGQQIGAQAQIAQQQQQGQLIGGLISGGAALAAAASDKNMKKNISAAKKDTASFLNALSAQKYNYKDESKPGTSPGKNYGIMAQDLEKSPMGKSLVIDTPDGKMVDVRRGFGAALAGMAELNRRTADIEKALKKRKLKSKKES